ncbi:MAG: PD-(D/E)XK nuclease family protein [Ruminococcus sp.]|nr:PD-(D/E)XK nuclease family protein [Ruminococcus sp.]
MLRLIKGRSKSGKTEYVRNLLGALAQQGDTKLLMIVPDQQSFDTEKAFLELLGPRDAMNVKVLGFSRLCDYVFEHAGVTHGVLADDATKTLLMSIALEDTKDAMKLYSDKADSSQLLSMMLSIRQEFVRNKVTPELISKATADNQVLRDKLHDVSLVLSAYDALLANSFDDPDGELSIACDLLKLHPVFADYTICVDSYLSFTQLELDILEQLMLQCKDLLVTLSDDGNAVDDSIFSVSQETATRIIACAKNNSIPVGTPVVCDYKGYFTSPEILHIEENIFRSSTPFSMEQTDSVYLYSATDRYEESDFIARNIRRLVMTGDYRYKDIAVVSRSTSAYNGILDISLNSYDVPFFMDAPAHVLSKPLMKLITACFDCVTTSFNKDAVLSVIKSGLTTVSEVDAALFENYLFTWNLSGSKLHSEFTANPKGFADNFTSDDLLELTRVEQVRRFIIDPLVKFRDNIKGATAEVISKELYTLMLSLGADKRIQTLCDSLEASGQYQLAEEQLRLWQIFIDTLDRTIQVIGKRVISPSRFSELLKLQFSSVTLAFIPRAVDQVTVGDIERLRLQDKKIIFVIGAVDGEFPLNLGDSGIFTGDERSVLTQAGLLPDKSLESQSSREKYLCYYALTAASDKLFVSFPSTTLTGSANIHSVMITELEALFCGKKPVASASVDALDKVWAAKPAFGFYAGRAQGKDDLTAGLRDYYSSKDKYSASVSSLNRALTREPFAIKDPDNARRLFGKDMRISASQVEKYHLCRFMYFCTYGLGLRERRTAQIDAMEYGSFVHYILESFIKKYNKEELCGLTDEQIMADVISVMRDYAKLHLGGLEDKTERFMYLYTRVSNSAFHLIRHIISEFSQSRFTPEAFELNIGKDVPAYTLTLPTGQTVTIRGFVDRADIMRRDGRTYIRIVDYKTGTKVFDLSDIMYGLNLQMLIYLSVLSRHGGERFGGEVVPAGVLYMPAVVPVIDAAFDTSESSVLKERMKKLRMNGLILGDMDVLEAMERDVAGIYIPVSSKGESVKGTDNLASLQEFGAIFSKIDALIGEMAAELSRGRIDATPAAVCYEACEYCPYSSVCGHRDGDPVRNIFKLDRKEILRELNLDNESEGDNQ